MPSCLGIYTDKNVIKYAKMTSVSDKFRSQLKLDAYGVKFYDNIQTAVDEITKELECETEPISLALSNEDYYVTEVFSNLKRKDILDLTQAEYAEKKGKQSSVTEFRLKLLEDHSNPDKSIAMCVATSMSELANIRANYEIYKVSSISPLPVSIKNLFANQAIDEEAAVINIEDKTTITVFHRSQIEHLNSIDLGANEMISKLSEKYNSIPKAYDALKKVSAYLEDSYEADDETRDILDVVIPTLYEIRQRAEDILLPYLKNIEKIYITGTGAIINNIDLYFKETFVDSNCEVLKPFFVEREESNIKDIIEVNSAIALALDGVGMLDFDFDFNAASKRAAGSITISDTLKKLKIKEKIDSAKTAVKGFMDKVNKPVTVKKKRRKKRNISFDDGVVVSKNNGEAESEAVETPNGFGRIDIGLRILLVLSVVLVIVYAGAAFVIGKKIQETNAIVTSRIAEVDASIAQANKDTGAIKESVAGYENLTQKLRAIMTNTETKRNRKLKTFTVPNFLSKLMFIIPGNVRVTSIDVNGAGDVLINAESGQYAQLGYFVSRIKLERALTSVDMEVLNVGSDIKISISGRLP